MVEGYSTYHAALPVVCLVCTAAASAAAPDSAPSPAAHHSPPAAAPGCWAAACHQHTPAPMHLHLHYQLLGHCQHHHQHLKLHLLYLQAHLLLSVHLQCCCCPPQSTLHQAAVPGQASASNPCPLHSTAQAAESALHIKRLQPSARAAVWSLPGRLAAAARRLGWGLGVVLLPAAGQRRLARQLIRARPRSTAVVANGSSNKTTLVSHTTACRGEFQPQEHHEQQHPSRTCWLRKQGCNRQLLTTKSRHTAANTNYSCKLSHPAFLHAVAHAGPAPGQH